MTERVRSGRRECGAALLLIVLLCGCGGGDEQGEGARTDDPPTPAENVVTEPPPPTREERWDALADRAEAELAEGRLDDVRTSLDEAAEIAGEESLDEDRTARHESIEERLTAARREVAEREREQQAARRIELLEAARRAVDSDRLEDATRALADLRAAAPDDEQRAAAAKLDDEIERQRAARRRLGSWLKLLGSENPAEVRAARNQLSREPDALPLVVAMLREPDDLRVRNALELLHQMRQPERILPEVVELLKDPGRRANWPDAASFLIRSRTPGAGRELLDLAATSDDAEQRGHALTALGDVPDPPDDTLTTLLPRLQADGPDLPLALRAISRAVLLHDQRDFAARRNLPVELDDERRQHLDSLPERLLSLATTEGSEAAGEARELRAVLRLNVPSKLEGVAIHVANDAPADGPAAALLDGVWTSTDLATMWRYPNGETGSVVLDLGEMRTVTGVRIWNFNQPGGGHRGWKEVDVYVSESQTALDPVVRGLVLRAPGAENPPDYGVVIPVPFVRGRYVKLVEVSNWGSDSYEGLAEIEVLGF